MKKMMSSIVLISVCPILLAGEVPGKSVLFPNHEIKFAHQRDSSNVAIHRSQIVVNDVFDGNKKGKLSFKASDVQELILLKEIPELRGRLINAYDDEDRKFLSQLHLRLNFKPDQSPVLITGNEKQTLSSLVLSIDFKVENEEQRKKLESDFHVIDQLSLPMTMQVRTLKDTGLKLAKYSKEIGQYPLGLSQREVAMVVDKFFNQKIDRETFDSEKFSSSTLVWSTITEVIKKTRGFNYIKPSRIRMRGGDERSSQLFNQLKLRKIMSNPSMIEQNLEMRNLKGALPEFRFLSLKDELCIKELEVAKDLECLGALKFNQSQVDSALSELEKIFKERSLLKHDYIHKGFEAKIDHEMSFILKSDNDLIDRGTKEAQVLRLRMWDQFLKIVARNKNYDEIRFFEEGGFFKEYSPRFIDLLTTQMLNSKTELLTQAEVQRESIESIRGEFIDTKLEHLGNNMANEIINILGQIFKKRDWVPYIRISSNFRQNYLTEFRERVFKDLFTDKGMKPGDIILEKDLQANTDVLIPGYWVHASIYLGSIKDLKRLGMWNSPSFDVIQYEIEKYKTSVDRQHYLNDVWKNNLDWEDIPWFYESDRTGVAVHPLIKFLRTDGMAVLRPTKNYGVAQIQEVMKRANQRMYFSYDYNHNVRNKFTVSCSKVVLKVFDQITFPVSHNLGYVSVSPDQIGQAVSLDPQRQDEGELKLIMFLDAYAKGKKTYDYSNPETYGTYREYLKSSGAL
ncbi:MAG: hypothetical protein CO099_13055 [Bdellovibrio sp. CG_4_9_14_3_um_filter_39_7]|nr:MAG: hypothetical protein CO099_13055 [Bdellovibrio sp. CG_4_9_14_3_um_filter_39_7]